MEGQTSPYLRQHLHNPVDWYPWGDEALEKARRENKPLLVSIGYSACHWCHVMERESFEDEEVAQLMNRNFVCIKVDREERPDIDHLYINAVQMISGHAGWPLNCFALPDGRPFWGATYFPKEQWKNILIRIAELYRDQPDDVIKQAENITRGLSEKNFVEVANERPAFGADDARRMYANLMEYMDKKEGGTRGAPKFPLPNNYEFLLHYHYQTGDRKALDQVLLSLRKMAFGGIYDQVGGGFARYATDDKWKIPHFEKMLYDNGQLVSLYANAYKATKEPLFKQVVYDTISFVTRELLSPDGLFYSALDADSEGEEGKYYVWKEKELDEVLGDDAPIVKKYYHVGEEGFWEKGNNILIRKHDDQALADLLDMDVEKLQSVVSRGKEKLLAARSKRVRPGLDDKVLVSWNALMIKGLTDAFAAFGDDRFLSQAQKAADFIILHAMQEDGMLYRSLKGQKATIKGFLEDYALFAQALIRLYEMSAHTRYLEAARKLVEYVLGHFTARGTSMFTFSPVDGEKLAAPHFEMHDNVMPASNSVMARVLFYMANFYENAEWGRRSSLMLNDMRKSLDQYSSSFTNWGILLLHHINPFHTIAVAGHDALNKSAQLAAHYLPDSIMAIADNDDDAEQIDVLNGRFSKNKTLIHVCNMMHCQLPVETVDEALKQINT